MSKNEFRISQSLLSSWQYIFKSETGYEDFLRTLNREKSPVNQAMLNGTKFESMVNAGLNGATIDMAHEWGPAVNQLVKYLDGAQQQVELYQWTEVNGVKFLLHGILDFLKAGVIYDTKFSESYKGKRGGYGKYWDSPQHPMYFALVPDARRFEYLISDGKCLGGNLYVMREIYYPESTEPIEEKIREFMGWLDSAGLVQTYTNIWRVNN